MAGWLVNDRLTCIAGSRTLWHALLDWIPDLADMTAPYPVLADRCEAIAIGSQPDYIIRNAAYFRRMFIDCPQIAFVQDVMRPREMLLDVCGAAEVVVFNSRYTQEEYGFDGEVIPIGVSVPDIEPTPLPAGTVLFVGSQHNIKGYWKLIEIMRCSDLPFRLVLKDQAPIPQDELFGLMRGAAVGICASLVETQHLAGIEMGLYGTPIVTTNVGVYRDMPPGPWGEVMPDDAPPAEWAAALLRHVGRDRSEVAACWAGFSEEACIAKWSKVVDGVRHAVRS